MRELQDKPTASVVDASRIGAMLGERNFTRSLPETFIEQADERLADYLQRLDEGDVAEA